MNLSPLKTHNSISSKVENIPGSILPGILLRSLREEMNIQLQILPLLSVLVLFLVAPVVIILAVSFWDYTEFSLIPDFCSD